MTNELKPCPFCGAELHFEGAGYEHPYSDTCPLDSLYIEDRHITAWNTRADADLRREREPVEPQRCAECDCENGGPDCNWIKWDPQPDALALVAAAYRDAADWLLDMRAVDDDGNETTPEADVYVTLINSLPKRTPADAQAALTAIERAAYERGVMDALTEAIKEAKGSVTIGGQRFLTAKLDDLEPALLALLTQEGR